MPYKDLLKGRTSIPDQVYLVTTVIHRRQPLLVDLRLGRLIVNGMREIAAEQFAQTLAFVVMPAHLHWLLQLGQRLTLSRLVQLLKGRSARAIGRQQPCQSPVWQHGFHEHAVRSDESLVEIARYVVMNPVRAGLVGNIGEYPLWDAMWL